MRIDRNKISLGEAVKVLGLKVGTQDEILSQFRKLVLKYHPDKGGDPVEFNRVVRARATCEEDLALTENYVKQFVAVKTVSTAKDFKRQAAVESFVNVIFWAKDWEKID